MEQETAATHNQQAVTKGKDDEATDPAQPVEVAVASTETKVTPHQKPTDSKRKSKKKSTNSKKSRKEESSESQSSSSSSSESDSESSTSDSDSDSSDDAASRKKKKKKKKNKKAKNKKSKKAAKKVKKRKQPPTDDDDSDEDDSDSDDAELQELLSVGSAQQRFARKMRQQQRGQRVAADPDDFDELLARFENLAKGGLRKQSLDHNSLSRRGLADRRKTKEKQKKAAKKKRASKVAFKRVDQLWDQSIHNYKLTETVEDKDADEWDQYIFTVRRKFDWEHKYQETLVDIKSQPLKECLQQIMAGVKGVSLVADTPQVDPNMLFLYLEETRGHMNKQLEMSKSDANKKKQRKEAAVKAQHLKILVKYLDKDYAEIKKTLNPMLENNTISFDLLWALFKPNTIAYTGTYGDNDQPRAFKIEYVTKESHFMKGTWYSIEGRYLEYDGKSFGMGTMAVQVPSFQGARRISGLDCFPLQFHKEPEALRKTLIERGKNFVALQGVHYKFHKGMAYTKRKRQILKININGRIMCDPAIHRRINPNYQISTVRPKEEDEDIFEISDDEDDSHCGSDSSEDDGIDRNTPSASDEADNQERRRFKVVTMPDGKTRIVEVESNDEAQALQQGDRMEETNSRAFTEEELLIASPVVLGFALSEKLWLEFTVSGISDVVFNDEAFDSLVLPENQKSIVKALVSSHAFHPTKSIDDIISGKGRGLCCVLHGPPGTGKTLTAEGIADLLKCPLYMVSAGDLGTDPRNLEKELQNILDIAHSWGAILLLDEADVFLEKRHIHDIHRNALVSIFLRLLEYFQGILFLTTNRVETFDEAFVSRIHLSLRYEELSVKARHRVWKLFLEKVMKSEGLEVGKITDQDFVDLARRDVNGRQIKNLVRAAQALAVYEGIPLDMKHIRRVIDVAETFERDLKGGTGYSDAMRSYT